MMSLNLNRRTFPILIVALVFIPLSYFSWNTDNFATVSYNYKGNQEASVSASLNFSIDESDMLNFPNPNCDSAMILKRLSDMVQAKIAHLQKKRCDQGPVLFCGKDKNKCGFGCDFHHRGACLMLSYVWKIPFVHDMDLLYPFSTPWNEMFEHLGSNCSETNSNRCTFFWANQGDDMVCNHTSSTAYFFRNVDNAGNEFIPYPLRKGIPIESKVLEELMKHHEDPFLWFVGQFYGYAFKFSGRFRKEMEIWRQGLRLDKKKYPGQVVGFHIRRTDKIEEAPGSRHTLGTYMKVAEKYFRDNSPDVFPRRIFIASDDPEVLTEAKIQYTLPTWNITGYRSTLSFHLRSRNDGTEEIVRDIAILVEDCDHVVCGLSSNVCRLILELRTFLGFRKDSVTSLDGDYHLVLDGAHTAPSKLIGI